MRNCSGSGVIRSFLKRVGIGEALRISKSSQEEGDKEGIPEKKKKVKVWRE